MAPHVPVAALEQAERIFAGEYASVIARPAGSAAPFVVSAPTMTPTNARISGLAREASSRVPPIKGAAVPELPKRAQMRRAKASGRDDMERCLMVKFMGATPGLAPVFL